MVAMAAVDIWDGADEVAQAAARWAARLGSTLDLVYASPAASADEEQLAHLRRLVGEVPSPGDAAEALAALQRTHVPEPERGETKVLSGRPLDVLPRATEGYDAALVATHGRTGVMRAALGSVADRLVRTARCPVCVMPLRGRMEPGPTDRLLVATDLSLASVRAAQWGLALLKPAEFHAVYVISGFPGASASSMSTEAIAEVSSFLDGYDLSPDEVHVRTTGELNPAGTIVSLAEEIEATAILTAARGRNAAPLMGLGSVTGRLLHLTPVPLWVLHA